MRSPPWGKSSSRPRGIPAWRRFGVPEPRRDRPQARPHQRHRQPARWTFPGVSAYGAGGVSSLPVIRGLADDRLRTKVDGMDLVAACPNHMNSPLSYIDPTAVESVQVYSGVTPVSRGR